MGRAERASGACRSCFGDGGLRAITWISNGDDVVDEVSAFSDDIYLTLNKFLFSCFRNRAE